MRIFQIAALYCEIINEIVVRFTILSVLKTVRCTEGCLDFVKSLQIWRFSDVDDTTVLGKFIYNGRVLARRYLLKRNLERVVY